jgi:hypothetical protein
LPFTLPSAPPKKENSMKIRSVVLMLAVGALALAMQAAALPPGGPCTMPATASATPAETAWRLFVAANCAG